MTLKSTLFRISLFISLNAFHCKLKKKFLKFYKVYFMDSKKVKFYKYIQIFFRLRYFYHITIFTKSKFLDQSICSIANLRFWMFENYEVWLKFFKIFRINIHQRFVFLKILEFLYVLFFIYWICYRKSFLLLNILSEIIRSYYRGLPFRFMKYVLKVTPVYKLTRLPQFKKRNAGTTYLIWLTVSSHSPRKRLARKLCRRIRRSDV